MNHITGHRLSGCLLTLVFLLTSCMGGYNTEKADEIIQKYEDTRSLSADDYARALELYEYAMNDALQRIDKIARDSKEKRISPEQTKEKIAANIDEINKDYPNMDKLSDILRKASEADMGAETYKKWNSVNSDFEKRALEILSGCSE